MLSVEAAREDRAEWARRRTVHPTMALTEEGLVLGAGTVLAKAGADRWNRPALAIDGAEERILTLLAVAYGKSIDPAVLGHIRRASEQLSRGEPCLALIQLAYTGLSKLADEREGSFLLFLAEQALADGVAPYDLLKACGIEPEAPGLVKTGYDPNQPRVPAGNPDGGRWGDGGSVGSHREEATRPLLAPAKYTPVHRLPEGAKIVVPPDGIPIPDKDSPAKFLMAPPHADFRQVYAAGQAVASLPLSEQYSRVRAAIAQEGTYDFQRDVPNQKFYDAYTPAANYAVGVYMAGAGYSLDTTRLLAKLYALRHSSNYNARDQLDWIKRGWTDGKSGRWR